MVELQVLNKVIQMKSLSLLRQNGIEDHHFITYKDEYNFIIQHHMQYGVVPDRETFLSRFKDFDMITVGESDKYLIETLQEQFMYSQMVPFVHKLAEKVTEDAKGAVEFIMSRMDELKRLSASYRAGIDIVQNSDDRREDFKFRLNAKGLLGIPTGIEELDTITHGWLKEDFIVIVGRTNEGKTWVMLFFLIAAWMSGHHILLYSGEMSKTVVGFRFDTINANFGNTALMGGLENLGTEENPKSPDDYFKYLNDLSHTKTRFVVVTPSDIGGNRLTIPVLHALIEQYNPDLIGIDQLSLMEDYRRERGQQDRMKYTHIAEDLYLTSEKYQKPIMSPAQATRTSVKKKKDAEDGDATPELEEISESDGIGQNATRVVSIKSLGPTMKFALKKNRYGKRNQELLMIWDIDKGIVKPFLQVQTNQQGEAVTAKPIAQGEDLF